VRSLLTEQNQVEAAVSVRPRVASSSDSSRDFLSERGARDYPYAAQRARQLAFGCQPATRGVNGKLKKAVLTAQRRWIESHALSRMADCILMMLQFSTKGLIHATDSPKC
jgi:hypothetical protein